MQLKLTIDKSKFVKRSTFLVPGLFRLNNRGLNKKKRKKKERGLLSGRYTSSNGKNQFTLFISHISIMNQMTLSFTITVYYLELRYIFS